MGRCLLYQASLPDSFWVHAFLTAAFLINCTSTPLLKGVSPFHALFHRPPDLSLLKVFGCLCFPHLVPYTKHKLEPRSLPCIFLGYSTKQKGYKCLYLPTGHLYISKHVVFHEHHFLFSGSPANLSGKSSQPPLFLSPLSFARRPLNFSNSSPA